MLKTLKKQEQAFDNDKVMFEIEGLASMCKDKQMKHLLTSFLAELCEEFSYCPVCLDTYQEAIMQGSLVVACSCQEMVIKGTY